jgi:two-component system, cell cycle response regulator
LYACVQTAQGIQAIMELDVPEIPSLKSSTASPLRSRAQGNRAQGSCTMISDTDIHGAKILIVDDEHTNISLLEQMLTGVGYTNLSSTLDPQAVCALHQKNRYDLILLDLQMPGMDGFAVMENLKEIETDGYLPILVITGQQAHRLRALASGARDFISKPFDFVEAKTRIRNMLEVRLLYKQLEHYNSTLESLALHDPLTGLPNRRLLMDRLLLSIAHARRNQRAMAVLYLDLDGFKEINDTLGHDAGDTLLSFIAARLVAAVREEDTVARLGGDEFVMALWELNETADVANLATKVIQSLSQPFSIQGGLVNITVSIGIGIYPTHGDDEETLMKSADVALYEAKRSGKNTYRIAARPELLAMA